MRRLLTRMCGNILFHSTVSINGSAAAARDSYIYNSCPTSFKTKNAYRIGNVIKRNTISVMWIKWKNTCNCSRRFGALYVYSLEHRPMLNCDRTLQEVPSLNLNL